MSFILSNSVNPPTAFIARLSELTDRFDPEMVLFRRKTQNFKYPVHKLSDFFREAPQYGAGERGVKREEITQPRYVRITDINEYGILTDEIGATSEIIEPHYFLQEDDLLIARSGNTVGKSYIHKKSYVPYACFFAGYLIRFRFDTTRILPDYVFTLSQLPYYKDWVHAIQRAAGQPNINAHEYSGLKIPVPPMPVQKLITEKLEQAYEIKRTRERLAREILGSIDNLLFNELDIAPFQLPPNTIENRIFRRRFHQVTGGRFDAASHWKRLTLSSNRYPSVKLADLVFINPSTRFKDVKDDDALSFIPMENISEIYGEIDSADTRPASGSGGYTTFQDGDIIWAKITPCMENGKSAIAENLVGGYGFGSTEFHIFRTKRPEIRTQYLHALLRLSILRNHARLFFGGTSGHQRVDDAFFRRLEIPLPPPIIQDELIEKIAKHKEEARRLFKEADEGLRQAKEAIESMILGEGDQR